MNNLDALLPSVKKTVNEFLKKLDAAGLKYSVIETRRTAAVQAAYYAQGRSSLETINALRVAAGLREIGALEAKNVITRAKVSNHQSGEAVDIVPVINKKCLWVVNTQEQADLYKKMGEIAESCGLVWGGRWEPLDKWGLGWDSVHVEAKGLR